MPRATGHIGGGSQCYCRRHMLEEQERLPRKIQLSYYTKGVWKGNLKTTFQSSPPYFCYIMERFQDNTIHQQSQKIRKTEVNHRRSQELITVMCPTDIMKYQQNRDGDNKRYQIREDSAVNSAKAHFKNVYKIGNFGLCNFGLLNSHIATNMKVSLDE